VFSGYPSDDRTGWDEFRAEYDRTHREMWEEYNAWVQEQGAPALADLDFIHDGALNLYVYPEVADYTDRRPWVRAGIGCPRRSARPTSPSSSPSSCRAATAH
jgi:hypothetical protein